MLKWIAGKDLREQVEFCLSEAPEYFFTAPASQSGRYHPEKMNGEGGLLRHTKACVSLGIHLVQVIDVVGREDKVIAALILHDTCKFGVEDEMGDYCDNHGSLAAQRCKALGLEDKEVLHSIERHMGQWGGIGAEESWEKVVHLADYLASRKEIGIKCPRVGLV